MNKELFTIEGAIKEGWKLTKDNLGFFIGYQLILWVLTILFSNTQSGFKWALWNLIGWFIVIVVKMGLYKSTLLVTRGIKPGFDQLYSNWRLFLSWVVANFLFAVMLIIGLALLIIPGCYVLAKYGLFPFFLLDRDLGPIEALKQAGKATENIRWKLFCLFLACLGINLLGLLFFVVGLLITIPVTLLALAIVYRQIVWAAERNMSTHSLNHNH